jgi:hypothetical protein
MLAMLRSVIATMMSPFTLYVSSSEAIGPHFSSWLALFCSNLIHAGPARTGGRATLINKPLETTQHTHHKRSYTIKS